MKKTRIDIPSAFTIALLFAMFSSIITYVVIELWNNYAYVIAFCTVVFYQMRDLFSTNPLFIVPFYTFLIVFGCLIEIEHHLIKRLFLFCKLQYEFMVIEKFRRQTYKTFRESVKSGSITDFEKRAKEVVK